MWLRNSLCSKGNLFSYKEKSRTVRNTQPHQRLRAQTTTLWKQVGQYSKQVLKAQCGQHVLQLPGVRALIGPPEYIVLLALWPWDSTGSDVLLCQMSSPSKPCGVCWGAVWPDEIIGYSVLAYKLEEGQSTHWHRQQDVGMCWSSLLIPHGRLSSDWTIKKRLSVYCHSTTSHIGVVQGLIDPLWHSCPVSYNFSHNIMQDIIILGIRTLTATRNMAASSVRTVP